MGRQGEAAQCLLLQAGRPRLPPGRLGRGSLFCVTFYWWWWWLCLFPCPLLFVVCSFYFHSQTFFYSVPWSPILTFSVVFSQTFVTIHSILLPFCPLGGDRQAWSIPCMVVHLCLPQPFPMPPSHRHIFPQLVTPRHFVCILGIYSFLPQFPTCTFVGLALPIDICCSSFLLWLLPYFISTDPGRRQWSHWDISIPTLVALPTAFFILCFLCPTHSFICILHGDILGCLGTYLYYVSPPAFFTPGQFLLPTPWNYVSVPRHPVVDLPVMLDSVPFFTPFHLGLHAVSFYHHHMRLWYYHPPFVVGATFVTLYTSGIPPSWFGSVRFPDHITTYSLPLI